MALTKLGNLCVAVRRYKDRETGEDKTAFEQIGALFAREDGSQVFTIKRTFNPAGVPDLTGKGLGDSVFLAYFPDKGRNEQRQPAQQRQQTQPSPTPAYVPEFSHDDDIPF